LQEERFVIGVKVDDSRQDEKIAGPFMQFAHAPEVDVKIHQDACDACQDESDKEKRINDRPDIKGFFGGMRRMVVMMIHGG
jgi:hypothetical protein